MPSVFLPIALLTSGIVAGVLLGGEIGIVPLFMRLPAEQYVRAHSFFAGRYDPFQPLCLLTAAICDVVLAVTTSSPAARALCVTGTAVALSVGVVSRMRTAPMGRWVKSLNPERLPPGWQSEDFRHRWGRWNRTRTGLAILVLLMNVLITSLLL
jgi:uncharacterized membrane protein